MIKPPVRGRWFIENRYICLFAVLLAFLVISPAAREFSGAPARTLMILESAGFILVIGMTAASICRTHVSRLVTLALAVPTFVLWMVAFFAASIWLEQIRTALAAAFLGYAIYLMLYDVFSVPRVTTNILCASLCAYLLLGVLWALAYAMVSLANESSFTRTIGNVGAADLRMDRASSGDAMYFSLTTLSTLGPGDIVPTAPLARMLTALEALVGQLYLAVLVARLVGLHIASPGEKRADREAEL